MYVPLVVYVVPFHKYELHAVILVEDVDGRFTVRFNVATLSQPALLLRNTIYVPAVV